MNDKREETLCVLLAGGKGSRLHPLTADRAKPSVPFGGKYRIIDFPLSNCLHSGIRQILILTQYKSHSLQKHLRDAWSIFSPEMGEYITAIPPQMRTGDSWYSGTADAIYQNLFLLERSRAKNVLILSGDHIYRMDYDSMLQHHKKHNADLTVACMQVPLAEAHEFGIMATDKHNTIVDFVEKPSKPQPMPAHTDQCLASMGIYIFNRERLMEQLIEDHSNTSSTHDFGHDLLPRLIKSHRVCSYQFGGHQGRVTPDRYWRDVGTIDSYYKANMDLLSTQPPLDLYQDTWAIRTYNAPNPPARVVPDSNASHGSIRNAILGSGSVVVGASITRSILSSKVRVDSNAQIEDSIIFENVHIGKNCKIKNCIIDKHVRIPDGTSIGFDPVKDAEYFTVSEEGVVVVPKD